MLEMPEVLTVMEAAKYLRLKRSTAYELVKQGVIPSVRLGRQIRIPRDKLVSVVFGQDLQEMASGGTK